MAGLMINCKEYALLLSQSLDQPLSFWEKVSIKFHQIICPPCKHIQFQLDTIRSACRFTLQGGEASDQEGNRLPDDVCDQMKSVLRGTIKEKDL